MNHLGHFILINRLLNLVVAAPQGRVVVVGSQTYNWAPPEGIQFDNLAGTGGYSWKQAYGQSKLANGLFSRELARKLSETSATSNSLHPGVINTKLWRHRSWRSKLAWMISLPKNMKTPEQGAATSVYLASNPTLSEVSGHYFKDCQAESPGGEMQNDAMATKLWSVSEELTRKFLS